MLTLFEIIDIAAQAVRSYFTVRACGCSRSRVDKLTGQLGGTLS